MTANSNASGTVAFSLTDLEIDDIVNGAFNTIDPANVTVQNNNLSITISNTASNPLTVVTTSFANITATGATLNGNLTSLGSDSSANVSFEYGASTSYGSNTAPQTMSTTGIFGAALTGLTASTTYHFRAKAAGSSTVYGSDFTFNTADNATTTTTTATTPTTTSTTATTTSTTHTTTTAASTTTSTTHSTTTAVTTTQPAKTASTAVASSTKTTTTTPAITTPIIVTSSAKTTTHVPTALPVANIGSVTSFDLSNDMNTSGMIQADFTQGNIRYNGNNQIVSLSIKSNTRIVGSDGMPVTGITVQPGANVPSSPSNTNIISVLEFGPSGTVFSSPITVVLEYDQSQVPQNVKADALTLKYFDTQTGKWENCDYTVDTQNHQITTNISHFSLYAVMLIKSTGLTILGWNSSGIIIISELILGALVIYYFLKQKRSSAPAAVGAVQPVNVAAEEIRQAQEVGLGGEYNSKESKQVNWDDILPRLAKKGEPFKTHLEIRGGKIVIPRDGKSADIEITNNEDTRIIISLEYDQESHPYGLAKIIMLGSSSEYEKSKEIKK
jgi:hypothetical protein